MNKRLAMLCAALAPMAALASDPFPVRSSDPHMNAAIARAKLSLSSFLATKANPPPGATQFSVKVKFMGDGEIEYMWVAPFRKTDTADFEGILINEPKAIRALHRGKQVAFSKEQIADWSYWLNGKKVGDFTTCTLTRDGSPRSKKLREELGLQCKD